MLKCSAWQAGLRGRCVRRRAGGAPGGRPLHGALERRRSGLTEASKDTKTTIHFTTTIPECRIWGYRFSSGYSRNDFLSQPPLFPEIHRDLPVREN